MVLSVSCSPFKWLLMKSTSQWNSLKDEQLANKFTPNFYNRQVSNNDLFAIHLIFFNTNFCHYSHCILLYRDDAEHASAETKTTHLESDVINKNVKVKVVLK